MKFLILLANLILILQFCQSQDADWWKTTLVYQIYPRSFQDSDSDGTGDIKGIRDRLNYLKEIGVETLWLSPVYESPMVDFGYDISNFTNIAPIFGSLADFQLFSDVAHDLGFKLVMDFVPNHSSDQHIWFQKSVAREEPYTDYYIWKDPKGFDEAGQPIPPNNWLSVFRNSSWKYVEARGQFYYHAFTVEQPDLNYNNPLVINEMKEVIRFWTGTMGTDGYRMDAVSFLFEDPQFRDEPESGSPDVIDENDYGFLDHIYTVNQVQTYDMIHQFNAVVKEFELLDGFDRVVMVEASYGSSSADLFHYYDVSDFPFNFNFISFLEKPATAQSIDDQVKSWLDKMPQGKTSNWVLGNHDSFRIGSRQPEELIDGFNMLGLLLPGVAVTYYGEEIGMVNTEISFEDTVDPQGLNCGPEHYKDCSRDPERTPMQWNAELNAGFTDGSETWLPVNPNYIEVNVEAQLAAEESHLKVYKQLAALRLDERIKLGEIQTLVAQSVFAFSRFIQETNTDPVIVAINTGDSEVTVDISALNPSGTENTVVAIRSIQSQNPATIPGNVVQLNQLVLFPFEAIVISNSA